MGITTRHIGINTIQALLGAVLLSQVLYWLAKHKQGMQGRLLKQRGAITMIQGETETSRIEWNLLSCWF